MLIYSGPRLSLLMLFAAGMGDIAWDFISQTLYISHGHNIGLLAPLKKKHYLHRGLVLWSICSGVRCINILSVFLFQLVWSDPKLLAGMGENWFGDWIHHCLYSEACVCVVGAVGLLRTPRSANCVCGWQSYRCHCSKGLKDEEWNIQIKSTEDDFKSAFEIENRQKMLGNIFEVKRYLYSRCWLHDSGICRTSISLCELLKPFTVSETTWFVCLCITSITVPWQTSKTHRSI